MTLAAADFARRETRSAHARGLAEQSSILRSVRGQKFGTAKPQNTPHTAAQRLHAAAATKQMATHLEVGLGTVEIDNADVVRLVLQYLREAGLTSAAAELEREADVRLNALTNKAS